jgi:glycosyltransferase involved in cell wall biosynthesis
LTDLDQHPRAVVAFAGARDHYQLPLALEEGDLLQALVTDLYWPADRDWFQSLARVGLPERLIAARYCDGLSSSQTSVSAQALVAGTMARVIRDRRFVRWKDSAIGRKARKIALNTGSALFCTNYYATEAFRPGASQPKLRFLFQLQAHPRSLQRILREELESQPFARASLLHEYELSLPAKDMQELCDEPYLANAWVTTSSYAAHTMVEAGIDPNRIWIVPYGVDTLAFEQRKQPPPQSGPLRVVYVGSIIQRKGLSYLFEAVRALGRHNVRLTLYTRGTIDQELYGHFPDLQPEIRIGLSGRQLAQELHRGEVFVLPSLSEGFGLVVLEAMACGLPVIASDHTGAPDVVVDGKHGFIIPIRDPGAIVEKLAWGLDHRADLAAMGDAAAAQARLFTWARFRQGIRDAYAGMIAAVTHE